MEEKRVIQASFSFLKSTSHSEKEARNVLAHNPGRSPPMREKDREIYIERQRQRETENPVQPK